MFEQLRKVKLIGETALLMHNGRTIRAALAAFKGNIYKNIYVHELSYPTTTKLYKFQGDAKQK
jgi:hypothetical protein